MSSDRSQPTGEQPTEAKPADHTLGWRGDTGWATLDRPAGVVVLGLAFMSLWFVSGVTGGLAWLALAGTWLLFPPVVSVVLGQFLLVALVSAETELVTVLPAQGALLGLLAADFLDSEAWLSADTAGSIGTGQNLGDALGYTGAAIALSTLVVAVWQASNTLFAGGLCLALVGIVGYGLRPVLTD